MKAALFKWSYILAAAAYTLYSGITGTGLAGWVDYLQMELFGRAFMKLTLLVVIVGFWLGFIVLSLLLEKLGVLAPGSLEASREVARRGALAVAREQAAATAAAPKQERLHMMAREQLRTLRAAAWTLALTWGIGLPVLLWTLLGQQAPGGPPPQLVQLDVWQGATPPSRMCLQAQLQPDRAIRVSTNHSATNYIPLTPTGWQAGHPLRFVIEMQTYEAASMLPPFCVDTHANEIPVPVTMALEKEGLHLAQPAYLLKPIKLRRARWDEQPEVVLPAVALFFGTLFSVALLLNCWKRKRQIKRLTLEIAAGRA